MPRRAVVTRRPLDPDPVHNSPLVTQLINKVLRDGKKSTSERIVYDALERIRERTDALPTISRLLAASPEMEVVWLSDGVDTHIDDVVCMGDQTCLNRLPDELLLLRL